MIPVIKNGSHFPGAIGYNVDKIENNKAYLLKANGFSIDDPTPEIIKREFEQLTKICPMKEPVAHISLNFSPDEVISDDLMLILAREFLLRMGYGSMPYVVYRHNDVAHPHIHIVTANMRVDHKGKLKTLNNSNNYYHSRAVCNALELEYHLVQAVKKEKKQRSIENKPIPYLYGEVPTYEYLKKVIEYTLNNFLVTNTIELNKLLNPYSVRVYVNKALNGEKYYKFSFINPGQKKSVGVSGTPCQLKMNYNHSTLQEYFIENKNKLKEIIQVARKNGKEWLRNYYSLSPADLRHKLKKISIDYVNGEIAYKGHVLTLYQLGLPVSFLKPATVKKEYYKAFIYTVTQFRKESGIRYESTLLTDSGLMDKMKIFVFNNMNLSRAQINILFDGYSEYKSKCLADIREKENKKDIKWVNKVITYLNGLFVSETDKLLLAEKLGMKISSHETCILGGMPQDNHFVGQTELLPLTNDHKSKESHAYLITHLSDQELEVIKGCVSGKLRYYKNMDYRKLLPLLPEGIEAQIKNAANIYRRDILKKHLNTLLPDQKDLQPGKLLRWDDEDEDDEDIENQKRIGRNLGI